MLVNPVFSRELKTTFRTWRTFYSIAAYVLILAAFTSLIFMAFISDTYNGFNPKNMISLYMVMSGFQLFLILLITPSYCGGAVSGEIERQTLDLILVTKMSSVSIILGKLFSSMITVIIMIAASMPVYSVVFYYGGVSLSGFIINFIFCISNAMFIGSIAIFLSTVFRKTVTATIVTLFILISLSIGTVSFAFILFSILKNNFNLVLPVGFYIVFFSLNPIIGFISIFDYQTGVNVWNSIGTFSLDSTVDFGFLKFWHINIIANTVLTALFVKFAAINISNLSKKNNR